MGSITYRRIHGSSSVKRTSGGLNPTCVTVDDPLRVPASKNFVFNDTETRTRASGDRVHALPFTGTYLTVEPMTGTLNCVGFSNSDRSVPDFMSCGEPGRTTRWATDIGYLHSNPATLSLPPSDANLQARLKALADTKALADLRRSYVNVPLLVVERKETVKLIAQKAKQLTNLIRGKQVTARKLYKMARNKDKRRIARDIAGEHLAFLFGVLPLVEEAKGLCDLLVANDSVVLTGRGRASEIDQQVANLSYTPPATAVGAVFEHCYLGDQTTFTRYSHRTSLRTILSVEASARMRDLGFNPIATAYDLVPLSFLSDFVSNLGTFLRSYDPLIGVRFETGSSTSWRERSVTVSVQGTSTENSYKYIGTPYTKTRRVNCVGSGSGKTRVLSVQRSVLTDYPSASLMFVNNLSWGKAATLASLAVLRYIKPVRRLVQLQPFRYKGPRPKYLPPINYK